MRMRFGDVDNDVVADVPSSLCSVSVLGMCELLFSLDSIWCVCKNKN